MIHYPSKIQPLFVSIQSTNTDYKLTHISIINSHGGSPDLLNSNDLLCFHFPSVTSIFVIIWQPTSRVRLNFCAIPAVTNSILFLYGRDFKNFVFCHVRHFVQDLHSWLEIISLDFSSVISAATQDTWYLHRDLQAEFPLFEESDWLVLWHDHTLVSRSRPAPSSYVTAVRTDISDLSVVSVTNLTASLDFSTVSVTNLVASFVLSFWLPSRLVHSDALVSSPSWCKASISPLLEIWQKLRSTSRGSTQSSHLNPNLCHLLLDDEKLSSIWPFLHPISCESRELWSDSTDHKTWDYMCHFLGYLVLDFRNLRYSFFCTLSTSFKWSLLWFFCIFFSNSASFRWMLPTPVVFPVIKSDVRISMSSVSSPVFFLNVHFHWLNSRT